jgi:hypothetical protein
VPTVFPDTGVPQIWKLSRRMHWAAIALMVGWFRHTEREMRAPTVANRFATATWSADPAWFPAGASPPDLIGVLPDEPAWKDYLTYYGLVYIAYNAGPAAWVNTLRTAEAAHGASPLSLRDFLVFRAQRQRQVIGNMVRFVIGLDAFLRVNYLGDLAPADYPSAAVRTTPASGRSWGV